MTDPKLTAVISLALAGMPPVSEVESIAIVESYKLALSQIPLEFVTQGLTNLLSGCVNGYSGDWAPRPAQIAKEARRLWYDQIGKEQWKEDLERQFAISEQDIPEKTDDEKEKRARKIDEMIAGIDFGVDMSGKPLSSATLSGEHQKAEALKWLSDRAKQVSASDGGLKQQQASNGVDSE